MVKFFLPYWWQFLSFFDFFLLNFSINTQLLFCKCIKIPSKIGILIRCERHAEDNVFLTCKYKKNKGSVNLLFLNNFLVYYNLFFNNFWNEGDCTFILKYFIENWSASLYVCYALADTCLLCRTISTLKTQTVSL